MSSISVSLIVFGCLSAGSAAGMLLRSVVPRHHLSPESKMSVQLGMALVSTMSALVLGLLVSSAKNSYDTQSTELTVTAANVLQLDSILAHYGPETKDVREICVRRYKRLSTRCGQRRKMTASRAVPAPQK